MENTMYDYVIVGSGMAGLYLAHNLLAHNQKNFIILEKESHLGGRVQAAHIRDKVLPKGAGILRAKDKQMLSFYKTYSGTKKINYFPHEIDYNLVAPSNRRGRDFVQDIFRYLKEASQHTTRKNRSELTFDKFALKYLSKEQYKKFLLFNEDQDFSDADFIDTVEDYDFKDNLPGGMILAPQWQLFLDGLHRRFKEYIHFDMLVEKIRNNTLYIKNRGTVTAKTIVLAVTTLSIQKLLPQHKFYQQIHSQSFIRIYAVLNQELPIPKKVILLNSPLQKIIPIKSDYHLYMISYADNVRANFMEKKGISYIKKELKRIFREKVEDLEIHAIYKYYWKEGTHYYTPLNIKYTSRDEFLEKAQHPEKNIFVVGEMVSRTQGWTQGAVESVDVIFKDIVKQK